jgi:hypothetical protein
VHPEQAWWSAQGRPEWEWRSAQDHLEAVRYAPGATLEAWFELAARLLRAGCPAACLQAAAYPRRCLPEAALAWFELAARPEHLTAAAIAWCPRAAARPSAGAQQAQCSAQPAASAAPVTVLPPEAVGAQYAQRAAAAEVSRAWVAAVVRQPGAAAVLRARAAAAAGQAGAVELPRAAAAGAALLGGAAAAEGVARAGAAVRQPAVAAPRDGGQQREAWASASVCHPGQVHPWPAPPPSGRFARAMQAPRIAWP